MTEKKSIAGLRRDYTLAGLRRADLAPDPIAQFSKWLDQAVSANLPDATAMTLSVLITRSATRIVRTAAPNVPWAVTSSTWPLP